MNIGAFQSGMNIGAFQLDPAAAAGTTLQGSLMTMGVGI